MAASRLRATIHRRMLLLALLLFFQGAAPAQSVVLRTFEDDKVGAPPAGFVMASGRRDASLDGWTVKREGSTHVLVHEGKPSPHDSFAVAIFSPLHYRDVQVSVRFKAIAGGRTA